MQHGPDPSPNTLQTPEANSQSGSQNESSSQPVIDTQSNTSTANETEPVQNSADGADSVQMNPAETELDPNSTSESFFETWARGQEMEIGPSMLMVAGVVLAFLVIMRSLMKSSAKRKKQTRSMADPSDRIETINRQATGSMDPARKTMVDAEDLTRRMGAVLDNKATKIEILLEEATERIAQLEIAANLAEEAASRSSAVTHPTDQSNSQQQPGNGSVLPEALDRARLDQDRAERQRVQKNDLQPISDDTPIEKSDEPTFRIDRGLNATPAQESPHPLTFPEQVDELTTQGLNAMEIANKLNRPVGEVELVINLRRNSG